MTIQDATKHYAAMASAMTCGGCSNITSVASPHTCITCGRMMCGTCGKYCEDHRPFDSQEYIQLVDGRSLAIGGKAKRHKGCE